MLNIIDIILFFE